jgi:hypothetical protein
VNDFRILFFYPPIVPVIFQNTVKSILTRLNNVPVLGTKDHLNRWVFSARSWIDQLGIFDHGSSFIIA